MVRTGWTRLTGKDSISTITSDNCNVLSDDNKNKLDKYVVMGAEEMLEPERTMAGFVPNVTQICPDIDV